MSEPADRKRASDCLVEGPERLLRSLPLPRAVITLQEELNRLLRFFCLVSHLYDHGRRPRTLTGLNDLLDALKGCSSVLLVLPGTLVFVFGLCTTKSVAIRDT